MTGPFHLFEVYGVELEYMIVHRETLSVLPVADDLIKAVAVDYTSEIGRNGIAWSNELVNHVIEFKTNGPVPSLECLASEFQNEVCYVNTLLEPMEGCLLPTAAHPWMDPGTETRLWPHDYADIYDAYNRIFDCRGHGWSNLQSTHINLPFQGDEEFGRLHAAIRMILPILPALAASSPVIECKFTGMLDTRLDYYRKNQRIIPSIAGDVIPEPVYTEADYKRVILDRIARDIAPHDPEKILVGEEFLNSRGAIARFERGSIEIRLLDIQECPAADLAILQLIVAVLKSLVAERIAPFHEQQRWAVEPLRDIFVDAIAGGENAVIRNTAYLRTLGLHASSCTAHDLWRDLAERHVPGIAHEIPLATILEHGTLARRILLAVGENPSRTRLHSVYDRLRECLHTGTAFLP